MNHTSKENAMERNTDCDVTAEPARKVAYFSMEIGINANIPTYSGGLGVLAGDMIRSCVDLKVPLIAVTLLYRKGYFDQTLDQQGNQQELLAQWNPQDLLTLCEHFGWVVD
jgi:starch phosphorylase